MIQSIHKGNHPKVAIFLNNMGEIYQGLGKFEEASKYLKEALIMNQSIYKNHPRVVITLNNLSDIYNKLGNQEKAQEYFDKARKMEEALSFNPSGNGAYDYANANYWNHYYKEGLEQILKLRLENINVKEVIIKSLEYVWLDNTTIADKFTCDIKTAIEEVRSSVLIPLNLYAKHWVGIVIEKHEENIKIVYMDSEQHPIPTLLKTTLESVINDACTNYDITLEERNVEKQITNNCGSEVIENFIDYLTDCRIPQDSAVMVHSALLEDYLLGNLGDELYA